MTTDQQLIDAYRARDALQRDVIRRQRRWIGDLVALIGTLEAQAATDAELLSAVQRGATWATAGAWPGRVD